jgi:hypothetical protein
MLYLKILKDNDFKNIDSCDVVHGQFHFAGTFDSVRMANIFMDDKNVMPLVLESGDISIKLNNTQQTVSGTPLNDELFRFFNKWNQLQNQQLELVHKHDQAIMDGSDMEVVTQQLNEEAMRISEVEDSLVTTFVTENFDNVLGPGVFMMMTSGYSYPVLTPQIEDIMSKAPKSFKEDSYVKEYYQVANDIQARQNGLADEVPQEPIQPVRPAQPQIAPDSLHAPLTNMPQK